MADISAVVITHKAAHYLVHTLPPLVATCREIIVLNMDADTATAEVCADVLRDKDVVLKYARSNLFKFGFSHPRNYASRFATSDWLLAIDSDELIVPDQLESAFATLIQGPSVFDVQRFNYEPREGLSLEDPNAIMNEAGFSVESHRRVYRRDPSICFKGLIHEELWEGAESAYSTCGNMSLTLHHLSAYGENTSEKQDLYAYLLIKAQAFPGLRHGTNPWFFRHFVPENLELLLANANAFAARHNLATFNRVSLRR